MVIVCIWKTCFKKIFKKHHVPSYDSRRIDIFVATELHVIIYFFYSWTRMSFSKATSLTDCPRLISALPVHAFLAPACQPPDAHAPRAARRHAPFFALRHAHHFSHFSRHCARQSVFFTIAAIFQQSPCCPFRYSFAWLIPPSPPLPAPSSLSLFGAVASCHDVHK
jgi:hypothetical protein